MFDGLDRLGKDSVTLRTVVRHVKRLQALGVGNVVVGPANLQLNLNHDIAAQFNNLYIHGPSDTQQKHAQDFLMEVLKVRFDGFKILTHSSARSIVRFSGGILRDLISLVRDSAEIAYAVGKDEISEDDVYGAAMRLGRMITLGLSAETVNRLRQLRRASSVQKTEPYRAFVDFSPTTDDDIDLISRRALLPIDLPSGQRFILHPSVIINWVGSGFL